MQMKRRLYYILCAAVLIVVGLVSRRIAFLPPETGDALWAMTLFCVWRVLLPCKPVSTIAVITLVTAYLVEFSQLISVQWLVDFRSTLIGHLLLGQGFQWADLLAYTIGVVVMWLVCSHHDPFTEPSNEQGEG